jgi:dimethylglycine dehydrogenase
MKLFGFHAVESMRLEKGYRHWKADLIAEFNPRESGLDRFVKLDKPEFIGKAALTQQNEQGPRLQFAHLVLDCPHAPAHGVDSILADGKSIGSITSAGRGYRTGKNIAMALVNPAFTEIGTALSPEVIGEPVPATMVDADSYDPADPRMTGPGFRADGVRTGPGNIDHTVSLNVLLEAK